MNPRQQGDLGEQSAVEWLWSQGHAVFLPFGHSPDIDLVTKIDGQLIGVQVKTATHLRNGRWEVRVSTSGGNQSWNRVVKRFSANRCDRLFVLVGDGRRWFVPSSAVGGGNVILLGGPRYAAYEIDPGRPLAV